jgi:hypothetical protein
MPRVERAFAGLTSTKFCAVHTVFDDFEDLDQLRAWRDLIAELASRCAARYGRAEVQEWWFETWNVRPASSSDQPQRACPGIKGQQHRQCPNSRERCPNLPSPSCVRYATPCGTHYRRFVMLEEVSRRRLFGWLAAAAIAVTAPALVASEPAEAQTVGMERRQSRRQGRRMGRRMRRLGRRAARASRRAGRRGAM